MKLKSRGKLPVKSRISCEYDQRGIWRQCKKDGVPVPNGKECVLGLRLWRPDLHTGTISAARVWAGDREEENAALFISLTLIFLAALTTRLDVFDKLDKHAGAGTLVSLPFFQCGGFPRRGV